MKTRVRAVQCCALPSACTELMAMQRIVAAFLGIALVVTSLGLVYAKHQNRKLFIELQSLQTAKDEMDIEWGRLQLEQGTWATHGRIERIASERLGMILPPAENVVIVTH